MREHQETGAREQRETACSIFRLEDFTENLEDAEMPAPASISRDSDSERLIKVASRKHSIFLTSLKTEIARSARGLKLQRPRAEDALAKQ